MAVPVKAFDKVIDRAKAFFTIEMSSGANARRCRACCKREKAGLFHGRMGGMVPNKNDIIEKLKEIYRESEFLRRICCSRVRSKAVCL